jgi:hypothetical protein
VLELVDVVEVVDVVAVAHGPGTHIFAVSVFESGVPALFSEKTARVYGPAGTLMKQPSIPGFTLHVE